MVDLAHTVPREQLQPPDHEPRRTEDDPERDPRQFLPRRDARELSLEQVKVVGDRGEVGAREFDLMQR